MNRLKNRVVIVLLFLVFVFSPVLAAAVGQINLNTATVAELTQLKGIGEKTAAKIVEYRKQHKFETVDELVNVKGVGEKTLAKLRDQLTVKGQ